MQCRRCKKKLPDDSVFCCFCGTNQAPVSRAGRRGNGQGYAYKRGSTWTARWTVGYVSGNNHVIQKYRTKGGFKTKRDALAYAAAPPENVERIPTLSEYWEVYSNGAMQDIGTSKQEAYAIAWRKWAPLAHKPIGPITITELQETLDKAAPTHYPAKDMKIVAKHLYKLAHADGSVRTNLADHLHIPPSEEEEPVPFSEIEVRKFWDTYANGDTFVGFILLLIYTGMMPGELLALRIDNIDFDSQEIGGIGLKTKIRRKNDIVFPNQIVPVLQDLVRRSESRKGYLVGMNKDRFYKEYYAALERAGTRRLKPYSCRHTTATALALIKTAPTLIQNVMRHAKFSSTERYIHLDRSDALAAVNTLD